MLGEPAGAKPKRARDLRPHFRRGAAGKGHGRRPAKPVARRPERPVARSGRRATGWAGRRPWHLPAAPRRKCGRTSRARFGFRPGRFTEHLGSFDRANLWFGVVPVASERARLEALVRLLADDDRMVIVYAPRAGLTEAIAQALSQAGHRAAPYHAGLTADRRGRTLAAFLEDRLDVIVATCAFGMGIDKPQVRIVVHWTLPPTPEAYYQEAGRAGRDGQFARCVLLWCKGDATLHRRQLDVTYPPRALVERLWRDGASCDGVPANVRASAERLRLRAEARAGAGGLARRLRAAATGRGAYRGRRGVRHGRGCRRRALIGYFGERLDECSGCDRCRHRVVPAPADPTVAARLARLAGGRRGSKRAVGIRPPGAGGTAGPRARPSASPCGSGRRARRRNGAGGDAGVGHSAGVGRRCPPPSEDAAGPRHRALVAWRRRVALAAGVPEYVVLRDSALRALATTDVADGAALAAIPGLGPRAFAKHGEELLRLIAAHPAGR